VEPEDVGGIASALVRAVTDDGLVERGAELNQRTVRERLDVSVVRPRALDIYARCASGGR
jgi:hypothetical protein